ncbi:MAG TPA: hypothetical protein VG099_03415 [Gemmataceae bacterium]|jgi:hypothetical protein|nr:hypothetical protein [Gemmataceae bacterium]
MNLPVSNVTDGRAPLHFRTLAHGLFLFLLVAGADNSAQDPSEPRRHRNCFVSMLRGLVNPFQSFPIEGRPVKQIRSSVELPARWTEPCAEMNVLNTFVQQSE